MSHTTWLAGPWRSLRHQLHSRRNLLITSIREHASQAHIEHVPTGGLNLWARLPDGVDLGS